MCEYVHVCLCMSVAVSVCLYLLGAGVEDGSGHEVFAILLPLFDTVVYVHVYFTFQFLFLFKCCLIF